jgi:hypothetical protein
MTQVLTREEMKVKAPSIFAEHAADRTSDLYQQYPTSKIVDMMEKEGWFAVKAQEQRINIPERAGFQKHIIRFRNERDIKALDSNKVVGSEFFEVILMNSHDGRSCYGLVVGNDSFSMKVRHIGYPPREVIFASMKMVKEMPKIMNSVERFKKINLGEPERKAFAEAAYALKWEPENAMDRDSSAYDEPFEAGVRFSPANLLVPRRTEDAKTDLWSTFNVVQENIMKGRHVATDKGLRKVRAVKSIKEDMRLNKALWLLTEKMAKIKKAS